MRIAIVHHHLQPGGVTRVIENAVASGSERGHEFVVLSGKPCPENSPLRQCSVTVDGLDYRASADGLAADVLAERMRQAAGEVDVWHTHNHILGKNAVFSDAVALLAEAGEKLLLQIHDFSEDGRPSNYAIASKASNPYPVNDGVHYAVLTSRDRSILAYAGVPEERLHLLPNPVALPFPEESKKQKQKSPISGKDTDRLLFYPTRGIRRKNIGEVAFLGAVLESEGVRIATSRAPENQLWRAIYDRWEAFTKKHALPVSLGVVRNPEYGDHSFNTWLEAANGILTTSIAEGFGLAFLEPFLTGKPLVGRDLPDVTMDFRKSGLKFPGLYRALLVPESWIDVQAFQDRLGELLARQFAAYNIVLPKDAEGRALEAMMLQPHYFDFGCLEEPFQESVIEKIVEQPEAIDDVRVLDHTGEVAAAKPWLRKRMDMLDRTDAETANILNKHYSLASYGKRLSDCYQQVASEMEVSFSIDPSVILNVFLAPERFHMLRTN